MCVYIPFSEACLPCSFQTVKILTHGWAGQWLFGQAFCKCSVKLTGECKTVHGALVLIFKKITKRCVYRRVSSTVCFQWSPDSYCLFLLGVLQSVDPVQPPPADISWELIMLLQLWLYFLSLSVPWTFWKLIIQPPSPAIFWVPQDLLDPNVIYCFCLMIILYCRFKSKMKRFKKTK